MNLLFRGQKKIKKIFGMGIYHNLNVHTCSWGLNLSYLPDTFYIVLRSVLIFGAPLSVNNWLASLTVIAANAVRQNVARQQTLVNYSVQTTVNPFNYQSVLTEYLQWNLYGVDFPYLSHTVS